MAPLWRFERHIAIERTVPPGSPAADRCPVTDPAAGTAWAPGPTERESLSSWRQYVGSLECPHYCGVVVQGVEGCRVRVLFSFVGGTGHAEPMVPICLLYTSPSPRDRTRSRMPSSA